MSAVLLLSTAECVRKFSFNLKYNFHQKMYKFSLHLFFLSGTCLRALREIDHKFAINLLKIDKYKILDISLILYFLKLFLYPVILSV